MPDADTTVVGLRRGGRAADCRRLESARGATLRGFKSLPRRVVTWQRMLGDFAVLVAVIALVGATAPRWPDRWLDVGAWHVPFLPWETSTFYRRIGVALSRHENDRAQRNWVAATLLARFEHESGTLRFPLLIEERIFSSQFGSRFLGSAV